jgi:hypothetical protein
MENKFERLRLLADWAESCGMKTIPAPVDLIAWAADRAELLESMIGDDIDLEGSLTTPYLTEEISEEKE